MIQTVVKRDGRLDGFNEMKIVAAICKAMKHTEAGEGASLAKSIARVIALAGA
ncbi:MAG: ATP cone domain-containing protein, partial [Prevotella sp.]